MSMTENELQTYIDLSQYCKHILNFGNLTNESPKPKHDMPNTTNSEQYSHL